MPISAGHGSLGESAVLAVASVYQKRGTWNLQVIDAAGRRRCVASKATSTKDPKALALKLEAKGASPVGANSKARACSTRPSRVTTNCPPGNAPCACCSSKELVHVLKRIRQATRSLRRSRARRWREPWQLPSRIQSNRGARINNNKQLSVLAADCGPARPAAREWNRVEVWQRIAAAAIERR
jgi:hypothetical protein